MYVWCCVFVVGCFVSLDQAGSRMGGSCHGYRSTSSSLVASTPSGRFSIVVVLFLRWFPFCYVSRSSCHLVSVEGGWFSFQNGASSRTYTRENVKFPAFSSSLVVCSLGL
uniref:Putative secreted peptide n=1 Tax=Anopheles braziliensis TaxID=58242 RepID=A0A2M3ZPU7_9DIPT